MPNSFPAPRNPRVISNSCGGHLERNPCPVCEHNRECRICNIELPAHRNTPRNGSVWARQGEVGTHRNCAVALACLNVGYPPRSVAVDKRECFNTHLGFICGPPPPLVIDVHYCDIGEPGM